MSVFGETNVFDHFLSNNFPTLIMWLCDWCERFEKCRNALIEIVSIAVLWPGIQNTGSCQLRCCSSSRLTGPLGLPVWNLTWIQCCPAQSAGLLSRSYIDRHSLTTNYFIYLVLRVLFWLAPTTESPRPLPEAETAESVCIQPQIDCLVSYFSLVKNLI